MSRAKRRSSTRAAPAKPRSKPAPVEPAATVEPSVPEEAPAESMAGRILERMVIPEHGKTYAIGAGAKRLTFLSQQQRALNLLWALKVTNQLPDGARAAVVGGGLAGITAATAAHLLGAKVTLLERKAEILHLQRGTHQRFIQPNIYDWPDPGTENPMTDLPFFNWGAGMASTIVETIVRQWVKFSGSIKELLNHDVLRIRAQDNGAVWLRAEGPSGPQSGPGIYQDTFDVVILAVGFGLERQAETLPFLSYWENDNLARPVMRGPLPRHYVVSGCGDGGLIDALRLRIRDFDHGQFVYKLLQLPGIEDIKARLREIDLEAARLPAAGSTTADRQGDYIWAQYEALLSGRHDDLRDLFRPLLRNDTVVYLNGPQASPFTLNSALLNRLAVFLLLQHGGLRYRAGRMQVLGGSPIDHVRVAFSREGYPPEELVVHDVVVRHGPSSAIERLLPRDVVARLGDASAVDDFTRTRQYPPDFWSSSESILADLRRDVMMKYAAANFPEALSRLLQPSSGHSLTLELTERGVTYVVTDRSDTPAAARRSEFELIPVEYRTLPAPPAAEPIEPPAAPAPPTPRPPEFVVPCGVGIAGESLWRRPGALRRLPGTGTLGCFVRLSSQAIALLTSTSAIVDAAQVGEPIVMPAAGARRIATVVHLERPVASPPGATLTSGTVVKNRFDAALAEMAPGVGVTTQFVSGGARPIEKVGQADIGDVVFKVGLGSGFTRGRIIERWVLVDIYNQDGPCWFEDAFAIESFGGPPFVAPGDAGAVIVRERDGAALGVLLGGSDRTTFACPMQPILDRFGCTLLEPGRFGSGHGRTR